LTIEVRAEQIAYSNIIAVNLLKPLQTCRHTVI